MRLMLQTTSSGWGLLGLAFWPALLIGVLERRSRPLALWAAATYLLIAFFPVSLRGGYQPYPHFHGRHILPACVPFALCLACGLGALLARTRRAAPAVLSAVAILLVAFENPRELRGFRDRPTSRIGHGILQLAAHDIWPEEKPIFMTPSTYWRYRILFPPPLRERLRVAVADGSPDWWKHVAPGIDQLRQPLPGPTSACLVGSPRQLSGLDESWDYGVMLPKPTTAWLEADWIGIRPIKGRLLAYSNPGVPRSGALAVARGVIVSAFHTGEHFEAPCGFPAPRWTAKLDQQGY
jgi:hypothetical protein